MKRTTMSLFLFSALVVLGPVAMAQDSTPVAPDNTAVNARDRAAGSVTAGQQSNTKSDEELSRKIRRAVVKDNSLSAMAHNVKIVTVDGSVTLRGPVKTQDEKDSIVRLAQTIAGPDKVDNQLEVKGQ